MTRDVQRNDREGRKASLSNRCLCALGVVGVLGCRARDGCRIRVVVPGPDDLAALEAEREAADREYNDALTRLDRAVQQLRPTPSPPPVPDEHQVTPLTRSGRSTRLVPAVFVAGSSRRCGAGRGAALRAAAGLQSAVSITSTGTYRSRVRPAKRWSRRWRSCAARSRT
jgi:hypothetical protein